MRIFCRPLLTLALGLTLTFPGRAIGQTDSSATPRAADSATVTPQVPAPSQGFHRGQWGAAFSYNSGANGIGALYFTSDAAAWVLKAEGSLGHGQLNSGQAKSDQSQLRLLVGKRWFAPRVGRIRPHTQLGVFGDWYRVTSVDPFNDRLSKEWSAGISGEVGAELFVTEELSFGASWTGSVGGWWRHYEQNGTLTNRVSDLRWDAGRVSLTGALYF